MSKENRLPLKIDPVRFADHRAPLQGTLTIKELSRLNSSLLDDSGKVEAEIQFGIDEQGTRFLKGKLSTRVMLKCQRCMQPFPFEIDHHFLMGVVTTEEEIDQLPEMYDPIIMQDGMLLLHDVIEDELIVMLPIVPMHSLKECQVKLPLKIDSTDDTEVVKENPFKVIESLLTKQDSKK